RVSGSHAARAALSLCPPGATPRGPFADGSNFALSDDDWRILRDGVLVRSGRFAQDAGKPWTYDPRRERDRDGGGERYVKALVTTGGTGLAVRAPAGLALAAEVS